MVSDEKSTVIQITTFHFSLAAFKDFSPFVSNSLIVMCLGVGLFEFIFFGVHLFFKICNFTLHQD